MYHLPLGDLSCHRKEKTTTLCIYIWQKEVWGLNTLKQRRLLLWGLMWVWERNWERNEKMVWIDSGVAQAPSRRGSSYLTSCLPAVSGPPQIAQGCSEVTPFLRACWQGSYTNKQRYICASALKEKASFWGQITSFSILSTIINVHFSCLFAPCYTVLILIADCFSMLMLPGFFSWWWSHVYSSEDFNIQFSFKLWLHLQWDMGF